MRRSSLIAVRLGLALGPILEIGLGGGCGSAEAPARFTPADPAQPRAVAPAPRPTPPGGGFAAPRNIKTH